MRVTYITCCPACAEQGQEFRLENEIGNPEVNCQNPKTPHKFPSLEDAEAYAPIPAAERQPAVPAEPEPAPTPIPAAAPVQEAPNAIAALDPTPGETPAPKFEADTVLAPVVETPAHGGEALATATLDPAAGRFPGDRRPTVVQEQKSSRPPSNGKQFVPSKPMKLPGGSVAVMLLIPEEWVGGIEQEAKNQGMTMQEHLQNVFTFGVESGWFC